VHLLPLFVHSHTQRRPRSVEPRRRRRQSSPHPSLRSTSGLPNLAIKLAMTISSGSPSSRHRSVAVQPDIAHRTPWPKLASPARPASPWAAFGRACAPRAAPRHARRWPPLALAASKARTRNRRGPCSAYCHCCCAAAPAVAVVPLQLLCLPLLVLYAPLPWPPVLSCCCSTLLPLSTLLLLLFADAC
jgi:hypothetical protein